MQMSIWLPFLQFLKIIYTKIYQKPLLVGFSLRGNEGAFFMHKAKIVEDDSALVF